MSKNAVTKTLKADQSESTLDLQTSSLEAVGQYNLPQEIFAGLKVDLSQSKQESEANGISSSVDSSRADLKPFVGINITPQIAAAYEMTVRRDKIKDADNDTSFMQHTVGLTYHNELLELGGMISTKVDDDTYQIPAELTVHGQTKVSDQITLGGLVRQSFYSDLDDEQDDATYLRVNGAYSLAEKWDLEAAMGYRPNRDSQDGQSTVQGSSSFDTLIGANYQIKENLNLGSSLSYGLQNSDSDQDSLEGNTFAITARMNYQF